MDRDTLSNYGWIVVLTLILSVLLALASPFGNFLATGFKATYAGFAMTANKALGIAIPGANLSNPEGGTPDDNVDPDDLLENAYALILNNSGDSTKKTPLIFQKTNDALFFFGIKLIAFF